ncbi:hypothetical protein D9757_012230 [Collybiopsis confluens]|uniref:Retrotransposon gag domain-containing protein n=1 Tax=Collybiopsis confluens TaxID=2823264 RepID=A0A8H5LRD9_9AGAR|nr:hypothetical protein D9757_012230 [Collybiopsis confluens]
MPLDHQLLGITNWATFRDHLKSTARSTGLLGYLDGSIQPVPPIPVAGPVVPGGIPPIVPAVPTPINSRTPSTEEWELRDGRLAGIIYQNIKDPRAIGVTEDMSSNAMWVKLTGEYKTTSAAAQALAKERIQQFKYNSGTRFEDYFKQLEALRKAANDVGCSILDEDLRSRFLTSLTTNNLWILQTHGARSYSDLKHTLIEYDMMVESTNAVGSETVIPSALAVPGAIVCDNCNRNGHTKKGCWARGGGREGFAPRWYRAPKGMEPSGKTSTSSTAAATSSEDPPVVKKRTKDLDLFSLYHMTVPPTPYLQILTSAVPAQTAAITSTPEFDCSECLHGFDSRDHALVHFRETENRWIDCSRQPCPNASTDRTAPEVLRLGNFRVFPIGADKPPPSQPKPTPAPTKPDDPLFADEPIDLDKPITLDEPIDLDDMPAQPGSSSAPPPPMTTEQIIHALAEQVANLTAAVSGRAAAKSSMNKPDLFKGQSSTEARRFLAQFLAWASEQPDLKNNHGKTIKSALGFLTDKAADWATPYLNEYNNGRVPFSGHWPNFVAAFKLRFESVDPEMEARAAMETIHQGKGQSAAEYSQHFKDDAFKAAYSRKSDATWS